MAEEQSEDDLAAEQPADWDKPCSEKNLAEIALWITEWREISPFLGLTSAEEHEILGSAPHSVRSQKIEMLRLWKKKRKTKGTYKRLCQVLKKCDVLDIEEKVRKLLTVEFSISSSSSVEEDSSSESPRSNPLTSYASYLKELYTSMSHSHTSQHWSHLPQCEFIQLAMIGAQGLRHGGPEEEMIRLAQQGKIETILSEKKPIDLHQLFLLSSTQRVVLIEGAPGGGKSTLALHICQQWAQGVAWLARFDLVVLAYLRDEAIQNASTLTDILPARDFGMSQSIASYLQATDGRRVLFIFDGWDEFPPNLMKKSLVSTLIQHAEKCSFHQSTVLITTRPVASGNLLHIANRRVEILGFTRHQIREYIEKALNGSSSQIQKLVQHLQEHPVIEGYCYIPLHVAILVHIFLTMKGALPTTLHELFCDLVLCCIVREHVTHDPDTVLPELSSLNDLPHSLKSKLSIFSILAYKGVMQDKVVFNSKDLKDFHLPTDLPSLGLLQTVEGLTLTSKSLSYNFLHLSVQELLAAYHVSQITFNEQVSIFEELFHSSRFQAVLQYYSGFTKLKNSKIQKFISYQRNNSVSDLLPLLHCLFEAQQPSLCTMVDSIFTTNMRWVNVSWNPADFIVLGYFLTSFLSTSNNSLPLCLSINHKNIDIHCLKLLLHELSKYSFKQVCPKRLVLTLSSLESYTVHDRLELPSTEQVTNLLASHLKQPSPINELYIEYYGDYGFYRVLWPTNDDSLLYIAEALEKNTFLTVLRLVNAGLKITRQNASTLIRMLQVNKSLTHLDFSKNTTLLDSGTHCIFKGLQQNTTLVDLNLHETGITATDPDSVNSLTRMLRVNKSLKHLNLSSNERLSDTGAHCIFESLQHNTTLVDLNLSCTNIRAEDPDTARSLTKMLQVNKSLTHLNLSKNLRLSDLGARFIFEGLQHNTTLVNLNLCETEIAATDPDTVRSLTRMLQVNKSLTHLDLSKNKTLSDSGARFIFEGLQCSPTLVKLNLSCTNIIGEDPDTACSLTKMLQVNKSLTHIDLSENERFSDSGACCILEGLQHNTTLVNLNITNTGITYKTALSLKSLLYRGNDSLKMCNLS